jgi:hypothetical protein
MMPKIPQFSSEQEVSDFRDIHSAVDLEDETEEVDMVFVDNRPREDRVSLRFDPQVRERVVALANSRKIGYRALLENGIIERLAQEQPGEAVLSRHKQAG